MAEFGPITRREFLKLGAKLVAGGAAAAVLAGRPTDVVKAAGLGLTGNEGGNVGPDPKRGEEKKEQLLEFQNIEEARKYLEQESKWINGNAVDQLDRLPWENQAAWNSFRDLKTVGNTFGTDSHFVYLVPKSDGSSYSVLGLESNPGSDVIDFINKNGEPKAIRVTQDVPLNKLITRDYSTLSIHGVLVGPDLPMSPQANIYTTDKKAPGCVSGFVASTDGTRYHYFSGSVKQ